MFHFLQSRVTRKRTALGHPTRLAAQFQAELLETRRVLSAASCHVPDDVTLPEPPAQIGLLLPAVQKVREAAQKTEELTLGHRDGHAQVGLLLPAVQKVREAACEDEHELPKRPVEDPSAARVGLLLPAVQKVREAASRTEQLTLNKVSDNAPVGLLLPAVQKVRDAAG